MRRRRRGLRDRRILWPAGVIGTISATMLALNTDAVRNAHALREARRSAESFLRRLQTRRLGTAAGLAEASPAGPPNRAPFIENALEDTRGAERLDAHPSPREAALSRARSDL